MLHRFDKSDKKISVYIVKYEIHLTIHMQIYIFTSIIFTHTFRY